MGDSMTTKGKPVLGRGLASLIPRPLPTSPPQPEARQDDGTTTEIIANVELDKIQTNPYQPRAHFDPVALDELRQSIVEKGIIQPITVRRIAEGYQLISGERRLRAAREAGLLRIPAYIIHVRSDEEMLELALIENLQREHLNPIEIAISYRRLIEEVHLTQDQLSQRIGKDRTTITNFLRLLKLPEAIQNAVRRNEVSSGHARALINVEDTAVQLTIFHRIIDKQISVREVERLAREYQKGKTRRTAVHTAPTVGTGMTGMGSAVASVEDTLRQKLGTKVNVKPLQDGKGEIVLEYYSSDDLERLLEILTGG
jgi:ParB family transcriptional regulator, chromosome partitioning protein